MSSSLIEKYDVLVVGAGASGLMAAMELSKATLKVGVLEARPRAGGRIFPVENFSQLAEGGAEFVHGNLPLTMSLLKEAGIEADSVQGEMWNFRKGKLVSGESFIQDWSLLAKALKEQKSDISVHQFLTQHFPEDKFQEMKRSVIGFVEGYDAADTHKASVFSLRDELLGEEMDEQFRIRGGYKRLIRYMEEYCKCRSISFYYSTIVREILWKKNEVEVVTNDLKVFHAKKILITLPLGILLAEKGTPGYVSFSPSIPEKLEACRHIGYGAVIKILIEFKDAFWESIPEKPAGKMGFLFSDAVIPTWWTQNQDNFPLLTGWLAGPKAESFKNYKDEQILNEALNSLSGIFAIPYHELEGKLRNYRVVNWALDPFTQGAYGYAMVETPVARKILGEPVMNTLFFGGEALYDGHEMGTVEAALVSGKQAAQKILKASDE